MANPFAQVAWAQQRTLVQAHAAIAARGRPRVKASNRNDSPGGTNEPGGIESVGLLRPGRPIREDVWKQCRRQSPSTQTHGPVFWLRTGDATARAKSPGIHPAINRLPADGDVGSGFWLTFVRPLQRRVRGGFSPPSQRRIVHRQPGGLCSRPRAGGRIARNSGIAKSGWRNQTGQELMPSTYRLKDRKKTRTQLLFAYYSYVLFSFTSPRNNPCKACKRISNDIPGRSATRGHYLRYCNAILR